MKILKFFFLLLYTSVTYAQQAQKISDIKLGEVYRIHSSQLNEDRELNIFLPPGYKSSDTTYPVIYLLDGGTDEDFIHTVGLEQFNSFPWVARMPACIIVGVVNKDRKRDMSFPTTVKADKAKYPTTGGSAKFIAFLEKEVQPFVKSKFRTGRDRILIGESMGGLLATEILITKPYLFNKYIIISPSLWWDNGSILKRSVAALGTINENTRIYIGVGKEGLAPSEEPHVMEVDANVLADKISEANNKNIAVHFDYLPDETHATIAYQAAFNAMKWMYK